MPSTAGMESDMKLKCVTAGALVLSVGLLTACAGPVLDQGNASAPPEQFFKPVEQEIDPVAPMVLRVVGYGAVDDGDIAENDTVGVKYTMGNMTVKGHISKADNEQFTTAAEDEQKAIDVSWAF